MVDYYKVLEVDKNASQEEIKKSFRTLAHKYHPDKKTGDEKKFKQLSEAYSVLSNEEKRNKYDTVGNSGFDFGSAQASGADFGFDISDLFGDLFQQQTRKIGNDILMDINITFRESFLQVTKEVGIPYKTKKHQNIKIRIPYGIRNGQIVRQSGLGEEIEGGIPGDLHLRFHVSSDSVFYELNGMPFQNLEVSVTDALLSADYKIKTLESKDITIKVPQNTTSGKILRVSKSNVSEFFVKIIITTPTKITKKAKEALKILKEEGF